MFYCSINIKFIFKSINLSFVSEKCFVRSRFVSRQLITPDGTWCTRCLRASKGRSCAWRIILASLMIEIFCILQIFFIECFFEFILTFLDTIDYYIYWSSLVSFFFFFAGDCICAVFMCMWTGMHPCKTWNSCVLSSCVTLHFFSFHSRALSESGGHQLTWVAGLQVSSTVLALRLYYLDCKCELPGFWWSFVRSGHQSSSCLWYFNHKHWELWDSIPSSNPSEAFSRSFCK